VRTIMIIQALIHAVSFSLRIRSLFFLEKACCSMNLLIHLQLQPRLKMPGTEDTITDTYLWRGPWLCTGTSLNFPVVDIKTVVCESDLTSAKSYKCATKLICGRTVRNFFFSYFSVYISVCVIVIFLIEKCM